MFPQSWFSILNVQTCFYHKVFRFFQKQNARFELEFEFVHFKCAIQYFKHVQDVASKKHLSAQMKRKHLSLCEKEKLIDFAKKNPTFGCRKIGEIHGTGKTSAAYILKDEDKM